MKLLKLFSSNARSASQIADDEVELARQRVLKSAEDLRRIIADVIHNNEIQRGDGVPGTRK